MKKLFIILLGLVALICLNIIPFANAQTKPKANAAAKLMTVRGTVTADEKSIVGDQDKKVWRVTNPAAVGVMRATTSLSPLRLMLTAVRSP